MPHWLEEIRCFAMLDRVGRNALLAGENALLVGGNALSAWQWLYRVRRNAPLGELRYGFEESLHVVWNAKDLIDRQFTTAKPRGEPARRTTSNREGYFSYGLQVGGLFVELSMFMESANKADPVERGFAPATPNVYSLRRLGIL